MESTSSHLLAWEMLINVAEFLDSVPYNASESVSIPEWAFSTYQLWKLLVTNMTKTEYLYGTMILLEILHKYIQFGKEKDIKHIKDNDNTLEKRKEAIERIRSAPQVEQRTENWYKESLTILSGSQYATILKPGRTRGQLVLEKAGITKRETSGTNVVLSPQLNPFMWGIRFEPVVKQLYQALTHTEVVELGRLRHKTNQRLGASPDGLVITQNKDQEEKEQKEQKGQERVGRFVEFKAPVTRPIYNKVPEEYNVQMQIQMEVGNVEECDYLEVKFNSIYKNISIPNSENPVYQGNIFIVEKQEQLRYEYSPLNDMEWKPSLQEDEQCLETVPWYTNEWYLVTVPRSREWYDSVKSKEEEFWKDVEGAKEGTWKLPESTRKPREKVAKYAFVDSENDKSS